MKNNINLEKDLDKFETLINIMKMLRSPGGCPWDLEQTIDSLKKHLLEETYELLESMDDENYNNHKEELGDLLLQIVFQSNIRENEKKFNINDVIYEINNKLIRRHPHIFSNEIAENSSDVNKIWENIKKTEKSNINRKSILDGIPKYLPLTLKAEKMQNRAAKVGFDWENPNDAVKKFHEEVNELSNAIEISDIENIKEEIGDIFFSLVNVARLYNIDSYESFSKAIDKFERRFKYIEKKVNINDTNLIEMDKYWEEAKHNEKVK